MGYIKIKVSNVRFIEGKTLVKKLLIWTGLKDDNSFIECYQEIDNGILIRYCDDEGNTIELPEINESNVIEINSIPNFIKNV